MINVYELRDIENPENYIEQLSWSNLWYDDLEEAGISKVFFAFEDDGLCIAIETKDGFTRKGAARSLIEESNCWKPERNECPDFWEKIESLYA